MKERPILFSAPMVRSLLDGSKTQTRRVMKGVQPWGMKDGKPEWAIVGSAPECPYGQPGDRLWVRENFQPFLNDECDGDMHLANWKTGENYHCTYPATDGIHEFMDADDNLRSSVKPSIHLPRWASRILLEVTGVRVERLQDISEDDARAEGCERLNDDEPGYVYREDHDWKICPKCGGTRLHNALGSNLGVIFDVDCLECNTYVKRYRHLWQSINGTGSWDLNPWVWVVEFKVVKP